MLNSICKTAVATAAASLFAGSALAQVAPDAGAIMRQMPSAQQASPRLEAPRLDLAAPVQDAGGPKAMVSRFDFKGNTKLGSEALRALLADYSGRELSLAQIKMAAAAVGKAYRDAGWVVSVSVPTQEVEGGVVVIQVDEARASKIEVRRDGAGPKVSDELLAGMARSALPEGEPIALGKLDRAILLAGDLPGVKAEGILEPGSAEKSSSLALAVSAKPDWSGSAGVDNQGSRSTGSTRVQASATRANPLGLGDSATISAMGTEGVSYAGLAYGFPLGYSGLRGSAKASDMSYKLVGADFSSLGASGGSQSAGLEVAYPLVRGRLANLNATLGTESRSYRNLGAGAVTSEYKMRAHSLALSGSAQGDIAGYGGSWSASANYGWGEVDLGGSPNQAADASGPATAGAYERVRWSLARAQSLPAEFSLSVQASGQWASKNLDSSEKMQLGGADGVRAYPSGEASGNEGILWHAELSRSIGAGWTGAVFWDEGSVKQTKTAYAGMPSVNEASLRGWGLKASWVGSKGWSGSVAYARRSGSNPLASAASGADQDGSLVEDRVWASLNWAF